MGNVRRCMIKLEVCGQCEEEEKAICTAGLYSPAQRALGAAPQRSRGCHHYSACHTC